MRADEAAERAAIRASLQARLSEVVAPQGVEALADAVLGRSSASGTTKACELAMAAELSRIGRESMVVALQAVDLSVPGV